MQPTLLLTGMGYIDHIVEQDNQTIVQICKLGDPDNREMTLLNCVVKDRAVLDCLKHYKNVLSGHAIVLQFSAQYMETESLHHCQAESKLDHIINIKAQLTAIKAIYIDGVQCYRH